MKNRDLTHSLWLTDTRHGKEPWVFEFEDASAMVSYLRKGTYSQTYLVGDAAINQEIVSQAVRILDAAEYADPPTWCMMWDRAMELLGRAGITVEVRLASGLE